MENRSCEHKTQLQSLLRNRGFMIITVSGLRRKQAHGFVVIRQLFLQIQDKQGERVLISPRSRQLFQDERLGLSKGGHFGDFRWQVNFVKLFILFSSDSPDNKKTKCRSKEKGAHDRQREKLNYPLHYTTRVVHYIKGHRIRFNFDATIMFDLNMSASLLNSNLALDKENFVTKLKKPARVSEHRNP